MLKPRPTVICLLALLPTLSWACSSSGAQVSYTAEAVLVDSSTAEPSAPGTASGSGARDLVAAAAASASAWDPVGPHVLWSPIDCRMPPPPSALASRATGDAGHGSKLYVLRSSDPRSYLELFDPGTERVEAPLGLALVKDAFAPEPVDPGLVPDYHSTQAHEAVTDGYFPFAERDGRAFRTGEPVGRFVMIKVAPGTPGSERSWIYGTVTPEGEVTSAGRVASCIGCHRRAPTDGLFGVELR